MPVFLLMFVVMEAFCAEGLPVAQDQDVDDDSGVPSAVVSGKRVKDRMLEYMQERQGVDCHEGELLKIFRDKQNIRRNLYRAIVTLRSQKVNIVHNCSTASFKILEGEWQHIEGCFKEKLWNMLENVYEQKKSTNVLLLDLSDQGYKKLRWSCVEAIKMLNGFLGLDPFKKSDIFVRRKKIWDCVLQNTYVQSRAYYASTIQREITEDDVRCIKHCWKFYKYFVWPKTENRRTEFKDYLCRHPEGVTFSQIEGFLTHIEPNCPPDVWVCVRDFLCCSEGSHLRYDFGRFFYEVAPQAKPAEQKGMLEDLCLIVRERRSLAESITMEEILFYFYQRKYPEVRPQEVGVMLDVLALTEGIPLNLMFSRAFLNVWESVQKGEVSVESLDQTVSCRIKVLNKLERNGVCKKILQKERVDIKATLSELWESAVVDVACYCVDTQQHCEEEFGLSLAKIAQVSSCEDLEDWAFTQALDGFEGTLQDTAMEEGASCPDANIGQDGGFGGLLGCDMREDQDTVIHKRRQNVLGLLLQNQDMFVDAHKLLEEFYGSGATYDDVCEDVFALMHEGYHIQRENTQYKLSLMWDVASVEQEESHSIFYRFARQHAFRDLPILEKTDKLYAAGYQHIPLSTVALYTIAMRKGALGGWKVPLDRLKRLLVLKDVICREKCILTVRKYRELDPRLQDIQASDVRMVQNSLKLYPSGCQLLELISKKSKKKGIDFTKICAEVLSYLEERRGRACSEESMIASMRTLNGGSKRRDVYRAIVRLRNTEKKNINYNYQTKEFTLCDGVYALEPGCYKRAFWDILSSSQGRKNNLDAFLELSNDHLCPEWSVIVDIRELYRLCFCHAAERDSNFAVKKMLWQDVVRTDGLQGDMRHYVNEKVITKPICPYSWYSIGRCFLLYKELGPSLESTPKAQKAPLTCADLVCDEGLSAPKRLCGDDVRLLPQNLVFDSPVTLDEQDDILDM